jgi:hypothetical protein
MAFTGSSLDCLRYAQREFIFINLRGRRQVKLPLSRCLFLQNTADKCHHDLHGLAVEQVVVSADLLPVVSDPPRHGRALDLLGLGVDLVNIVLRNPWMHMPTPAIPQGSETILDAIVTPLEK